jgi:hypothetical protein
MYNKNVKKAALAGARVGVFLTKVDKVFTILFGAAAVIGWWFLSDVPDLPREWRVYFYLILAWTAYCGFDCLWCSVCKMFAREHKDVLLLLAEAATDEANKGDSCGEDDDDG